VSERVDGWLAGLLNGWLNGWPGLVPPGEESREADASSLANKRGVGENGCNGVDGSTEASEASFS